MALADNGPRVLWLCKARYMNHDVINDRFGRLFALPNGLSAQAEVQGFCLDYGFAAPGGVPTELEASWQRANIPRSLFLGWIIVLLRAARQLKPDYVVASSDCLNIILGAFLARLFGAGFVADLYDDYSAFGLARIPGVRWLYHRALGRAVGISVVSRTLAVDMQAKYPHTPLIVLESTIDAQRFEPLDKVQSRGALGLDTPAGKKLVGVCGGLNAPHGADTVFRAIEVMERSDPEVVFILAGHLSDDCPLPSVNNMRYLGMLPHEDMSRFFSAMDVVIVALGNNRFGHHAFPQKAYEVLACRTPVVAADVGALALLFEALPQVLYDADSVDSLVDRLRAQLAEEAVLTVDIPTWDDQSRRLGEFLCQLGT